MSFSKLNDLRRESVSGGSVKSLVVIYKLCVCKCHHLDPKCLLQYYWTSLGNLLI